jgi:TetR/AcrR family transcriptional regulator, transcriptional repressor for nem operon
MSATEDSASHPPTARGAATRSRVVSAAADLIYARGVDRTSLGDVMAESGVSKSQLYHYFDDKDALVLEVINLQTERVLHAQQPHLGALDSLKALRLWRHVMVRLNKRAGSRGCPIGSLASELANDSEAARKRLAASFAMWGDSIEQGLAKMRERGALSPSANPHELAVALLSAVQGGFLLSKTTQTSRPLEIAIDMAIDHIARHMSSTSQRSPRKRR